MLFGDERAVLTFLRDTIVGEFVSLAALGGERGIEDPVEEEGEEGGQPPHRLYISFVISFVILSLSFGGMESGR